MGGKDQDSEMGRLPADPMGKKGKDGWRSNHPCKTRSVVKRWKKRCVGGKTKEIRLGRFKGYWA